LYFLCLTCTPDEIEHLSFKLWEAGTSGIQEISDEEMGTVSLVAGFSGDESREALLTRFRRWSPKWRIEQTTDWVQQTYAAWPARAVGERIFLAPPWNTDPTPPGRVRIVHNPGLACGTGEHPCTRLALMALEQCITLGCRVIDIGTGSGLLALAAQHLGAGVAVGVDNDEAALKTARENFRLNKLDGALVAGSADCLAQSSADVAVANINASVILSMLDELLLTVRNEGWLILTGFTEAELPAILQNLSNGIVLEVDEWRCVIWRAV